MEDLFELLEASVSPFHCVEYAQKSLKNKGFEQLDYGKNWNLQKGGRYMVNHHGTTIFAFTIGENYRPEDMIRIGIGHTDYPYLRIKPNPDFVSNGYAQVNVEVYGGVILNTWLDRPLGVAGRVALRSQDPFHPQLRLYRSAKPLLVIPNLAIHMNREINSGVELNRQIDMMPVVDCLPAEQRTADYFITCLAEELGVDKADILDFELNTFVFDGPVYVGPANSMISSPHLDNHTSCAALLSAIEDADRPDGINIIGLYDNEEVGSRSKQGADSSMTVSLVNRILNNLGLTEEEKICAIYHAMALSVDVAHAIHPNKPGKADITNRPVMGRGFCIKEASVQSYATDAEAIAILSQICDQNKIPYQKFLNRSDIKGGGTIGKMIAAQLSILTVDIGVPILAMHSARELMGTADQKSLTDAITAFMNS